MEEKEFRPIAKARMGHFGIQLIDIPKAKDKRTPDFYASFGNEKVVIELKIKGDDPKIESDFQRRLQEGELVEEISAVGRRTRLYEIVGDGVDQMIAFDPGHLYFRVIWLHCDGRNPDLQWRRFHASLFGIESLIVGQKPSVRYCYHFYEGAFYRWRNELDGAILTEGNKLQLCINDLSPRASTFRHSELVERLATALCDPAIEETRNNALVIELDATGKLPTDPLRWLRSKLNVDRIQTIKMSMFSGTIAVPKNRFKPPTLD